MLRGVESAQAGDESQADDKSQADDEIRADVESRADVETRGTEVAQPGETARGDEVSRPVEKHLADATGVRLEGLGWKERGVQLEGPRYNCPLVLRSILRFHAGQTRCCDRAWLVSNSPCLATDHGDPPAGQVVGVVVAAWAYNSYVFLWGYVEITFEVQCDSLKKKV